MSADTSNESADLADVPWLSSDQQHNWRALVTLLATLPPAMDAQLRREAGVNLFEYQVLAALSETSEHTKGLSELAEAAQGSLSRLSHAITRLERAGWVERRSYADRSGRRAKALLTDAGLAKLEQIAPSHVREARRLVIDVLTPEQLCALGDAARAITAAVMADESETCRQAIDC